MSRALLDAPAVARVVDRIAHQMLEKTGGAADTVMLGIPTRGVPLARRLAARIRAFEGVDGAGRRRSTSRCTATTCGCAGSARWSRP